MIGELNECVRITTTRFPDNFASFNRADLAEKGQDEVLGDGDVEVTDVEGLGAADIDVVHHHHVHRNVVVYTRRLFLKERK